MKSEGFFAGKEFFGIPKSARVLDFRLLLPFLKSPVERDEIGRIFRGERVLRNPKLDQGFRLLTSPSIFGYFQEKKNQTFVTSSSALTPAACYLIAACYLQQRGKMSKEFIEEEEEAEEEEQARIKEAKVVEDDIALKEMTVPTARETQEMAKAKMMEKQEQLCDLSRALAVLASASSVSREREEFLSLVNKEIELYNSMVNKEGTEGEAEAKKAYRAAMDEADQAAETAVGSKVSSALINGVDALLKKLENEIDDVDAKIGDRWHLLDRDYDGKVTPEEVAGATMYLKDTLGKEGVQELISILSKDKESWMNQTAS